MACDRTFTSFTTSSRLTLNLALSSSLTPPFGGIGNTSKQLVGLFVEPAPPKSCMCKLDQKRPTFETILGDKVQFFIDSNSRSLLSYPFYCGSNRSAIDFSNLLLLRNRRAHRNFNDPNSYERKMLSKSKWSTCRVFQVLLPNGSLKN